MAIASLAGSRPNQVSPRSSPPKMSLSSACCATITSSCSAARWAALTAISVCVVFGSASSSALVALVDTGIPVKRRPELMNVCRKLSLSSWKAVSK